jgi:perosamine synthetase
MITTNDPEIARLARILRDHAFSEERHFWHKYLGYNYRMTNMQAAVGLAQTEQLATFVAARRANAARYSAALDRIPGIVTPPEADWAKNVFWMYSILVQDEFGMTRDGLRDCLADHGIETRTFFIPMHLQPIYYQAFKGQRYPVAEMLCQRGFYLPSASSLTAREIDYVTGMVQQAHRGAAGTSASG